MTQKAALIIMDGWGQGRMDESNAIHLADTPFVDSLYSSVPNAELRTDGESVGLPEGQMGNSEVGHLNIGAGRIVYQDLQRIDMAVEDGTFKDNPELDRALDLAQSGRRLHLMGLLSDGGVHSSQRHLHALLEICHERGLSDVFVHAFTDGRDTDPENGVEYVRALQEQMSKSTGSVATVIGRYYAMDRDRRWERIKRAYDLLTAGAGVKWADPVEALKASYDAGIKDEFMEPILVDENGLLRNGDVLICFNFRTDRCRELSVVLTQEDMPKEEMHTLDIDYFTMCRYDETFKDIGVFFTKENLEKTIGEVISSAGLTQLRMAETEKYPHVTFFFSGGREAVFDGESRSVIPSPKVATYDLQPEMSAALVTSTAIQRLKEEAPDFLCLNLANPDMVGHTGVQSAIIAAVETTDESVRQIVEVGRSLGYEFIIIADHGNAEQNVNPDGSPHTSHTTNPVPIFYIGEQFSKIDNGILADVSPTLLAIMQIARPSVMTGRNLLS